MTLTQFRMLAADARADSVLRTVAVAVFTGRGLCVSVEATLGEATDLEIAHALEIAARLTGKVGDRG